MKLSMAIVCLIFASGLFAGQDCYKNARGKTVCNNGQTAVAGNPRTGNAAVSQKNQNGVTNTQTRNGGEAKTKNGKGVAVGPDGTVCAKGSNQQGCRKR
jgi:hypothetical protein